jgi:F-type H+-transporting ATPase subunit b
MHVSSWNIALQVANFLVLSWLLQRFLFVPVRGILERRRAAIEGALGEGGAKMAEAERVIAEYRAKSGEIADQAEAARQGALAVAEQEARGLREDGARKARVEVELAKRTVETERADALRLLEAKAAELATSIAARLLVATRPDSDAPFLWKATASIDALAPEARVTLGRQIAGGSVEAISARPLDGPTRERFERWLSDLAGSPVHPSYGLDEALIAGVELHLPASVLRSHLRALLERARVELGAHASAA